MVNAVPLLLLAFYRVGRWRLGVRSRRAAKGLVPSSSFGASCLDAMEATLYWHPGAARRFNHLDDANSPLIRTEYCAMVAMVVRLDVLYVP